MLDNIATKWHHFGSLKLEDIMENIHSPLERCPFILPISIHAFSFKEYYQNNLNTTIIYPPPV